MSDDEFKNLKTPKIILIVQSAIPSVRYYLGPLENLFDEWLRIENRDEDTQSFINFLNQKAIEKDVETLTKRE